MSVYQLQVDENGAGMRLDIFVTRYLDPPDSTPLTRAAVQRLIEDGLVTLNGETAKSSDRMKAQDLVRIRAGVVRELDLKPEALPLDVLYEDNDCLVINKAAGLVVHPAAGHASGTLVNALLHHFPGVSDCGGKFRPGIVHRLDKDTSGAMIVAKNDFAFQQLAQQFKNRTVTKEYLALVWGQLEPKTGMINRPIGRHRSDRKKMSSACALSKRREAVTEWAVERYFSIGGARQNDQRLTWVRLRPRTGRTHQLRVHLADCKHPLVGDALYGHRKDDGRVLDGSRQKIILSRQALHAERLAIDHPRTRQRMGFFAPLPADLRELLDRLDSNFTAHCVFSRDKGVDTDGPFK